MRAAQRLLSSNRFADFRPGEIDGIFGEESARACKRAKYWVGYAERLMTPTFGSDIEAVLAGRRGLFAAMERRRSSRLEEDKKKPLRECAFAIAEQHLGVKESPPQSNRCVFSDWYRMVGPWCAMFVSYCYAEAGSVKAFKQGTRWAYCPFILADARAGRNNLAVTRAPERGDIVLYGFGTTTAKHIGLFDSWVSKTAGTFRAIEGNTSSANDANGGEVMRRDRKTSQVLAFVHVGG